LRVDMKFEFTLTYRTVEIVKRQTALNAVLRITKLHSITTNTS
jgi:hypothetical protein